MEAARKQGYVKGVEPWEIKDESLQDSILSEDPFDMLPSDQESSREPAVHVCAESSVCVCVCMCVMCTYVCHGSPFQTEVEGCEGTSSSHLEARVTLLLQRWRDWINVHAAICMHMLLNTRTS